MAMPKSKIEMHRRINFMTQQEVAAYVGMSHPGYVKIENGQRTLSIQLARKLVKLFKLNNIEELLDDEEEHNEAV